MRSFRAMTGGCFEPTRVWPWVFHGWILAVVMFSAAATGLGRIYEGADGKPVKELPA